VLCRAAAPAWFLAQRRTLAPGDHRLGARPYQHDHLGLRSVVRFASTGQILHRPCSDVPSGAAKQAVLSNRGQHSQSMEPLQPTRAAVVQSTMANGKRQPKKDASLTLSPCAQADLNPLPTGLLNQARIARIRNRKRSISDSGSIGVAGTSKEQAPQRLCGACFSCCASGGGTPRDISTHTDSSSVCNRGTRSTSRHSRH
jgi:hypothetical protein